MAKEPRNKSQIRRTDNERRQAPRRRSLGGEQIEGRQAVRELLLAGRRRVEYVWLEESVQRKGVVEEIVGLCVSRRVPLITASRRKFELATRSEGHQGVLARAAALREVDLDEMVEASANPFLVVVDGITDPHNLGAVLRSAELAGATGVVLPQNRTSLITPTVAKAAAGAVEYLQFALVPGVPNALLQLEKMDVTRIGLDVRGKSSVYSLNAGEASRVALVLGAEDRGIARLTAQRCDRLVRIPQVGKLDSLNVSNAAAITLFELARLRGAPDNT
ncbi:MAG: 23S rRNA (guanosine(2251)-2'-O)-methyltransferase RlmB [Actinomycetota bacterium]|nr:23S rRNA (guanosine(2251)-2'-O)-methyltransferase RlmB [Actinomycetota bacterium]MDA8209324.1 23S rRNA (guanosine(2251)-2'-O)-methyltransferase RlmB [Actinomycetota bacterium]